jgi:hypothetical protein
LQLAGANEVRIGRGHEAITVALLLRSVPGANCWVMVQVGGAAVCSGRSLVPLEKTRDFGMTRSE